MERITQEEADRLIKQSKKIEPVECEPTSSRIIQTKDEIIINP